MPNIGAVLREEITRLSRKESRNQVTPARKASAQHRKDIAALKQRVALLERQVALLAKRVLAGAPGRTAASSIASSAPAGKRVRFAAKGLQALRARLALSQGDLGKLLGVSAQSIYNWENDKARPRAEQIAKLVALRGVGKREAALRLKQLGAAAAKARGK